ncbi:MAG: class I SAM-dependent methyltransferase [Rhodospirillaceae bacterium]|nr:class I SAM-dependent methyltransferase [Rhodospirillaceae bacterium]
MDNRKPREEWLKTVRAEWYRVMRPLGSWVPWDLVGEVQLDEIEVEDYFQLAARLDSRHLKNCRVVADRVEMLASLPKGGVVAEIGTDKGDFAKKILSVCTPREFDVVDKSLRNFRRADFADAIAAGRVRIHEADSVTALQSFPDGRFDWIYIDADHSYEGVKRDILAASRKVKKKDGLLALNDYIFWSHRELVTYGVVQAVNEFCLAEGWEILYLALHPEMYNDVVLRAIP